MFQLIERKDFFPFGLGLFTISEHIKANNNLDDCLSQRHSFRKFDVSTIVVPLKFVDKAE